MAQAKADDAPVLDPHPHGQRAAALTWARGSVRLVGGDQVGELLPRRLTSHGSLRRASSSKTTVHSRTACPGIRRATSSTPPPPGSGDRWLATTVWSTRRRTTAGRSPASVSTCRRSAAAPARPGSTSASGVTRNEPPPSRGRRPLRGRRPGATAAPRRPPTDVTSGGTTRSPREVATSQPSSRASAPQASTRSSGSVDARTATRTGSGGRANRRFTWSRRLTGQPAHRALPQRPRLRLQGDELAEDLRVLVGRLDRVHPLQLALERRDLAHGGHLLQAGHHRVDVVASASPTERMGSTASAVSWARADSRAVRGDLVQPRRAGDRRGGRTPAAATAAATAA